MEIDQWLPEIWVERRFELVKDGVYFRVINIVYDTVMMDMSLYILINA